MSTDKDNQKYEIHDMGKTIIFKKESEIISFSKRQVVILTLLLEGFTCNEIAIKLSLSPRTIAGHIEGIKHKSNCRTLMELRIYFKDTLDLLRKIEYKGEDDYKYDEMIFDGKKLYLRKGDKEIILTYNQMIVLLQILEGYTAKNIARKVLKEPKGVNQYIEILKEKFECATKSELIANCYRSSLAYYLWCIYPTVKQTIENVRKVTAPFISDTSILTTLDG